MGKFTLRGWLAEIRQQKYPAIDNPLSEAAILAADALKLPRETILSHPEIPLSGAQRIRLMEKWKKRTEGYPLPYLLGWWEFYGLKFFLNSQVLIPRPETEELVLLALDWLRSQDGPVWAADVGTGSGCIAVSLAVNCPTVTIHALDISPEALKVARKNARAHQVSARIRFVHSDLFGNRKKKFDLIVANLPYIPTRILDHLEVARREPRLALDGGPDGLRFVKKLLVQSREVLKHKGQMILEIEETTGQSALQAAGQILPGWDITLRKDLAGRDRFLIINRK